MCYRLSAPAGLGDIMLTCYGTLSRNRTVGVKLGQGEKLSDILASSSQVAEGVATAGARRQASPRADAITSTCLGGFLLGHRTSSFHVLQLWWSSWRASTGCSSRC